MKLLKRITALGLGVVVSISVLFTAAAVYTSLAGKDDSTKFTYEDLIKIKPVTVMGEDTLIVAASAASFQNELLRRLTKDGVISIHPIFGIIPIPIKKAYSVNIIIDSNGGYVSYAVGLRSLVGQLRSLGVSIKCYVANAQSSAFYFMVTACDRVVLKKGGVLMQHKSYRRGGGYSTQSQMIDIKMATGEAAALGVGLKEWLEFTRGSGEDRVFTEKDIKKYKLVDEVM